MKGFPMPDLRSDPADLADGEWSEPYDGDVAAERDRREYVPEPLLDAGRVTRGGQPWSIPIRRECPACGVDRQSCPSPTCIRGAA